MRNYLPKQYKPAIGQEPDGTFILGELRTRDNRNSRKRRGDKLKTEK